MRPFSEIAADLDDKAQRGLVGIVTTDEAAALARALMKIEVIYGLLWLADVDTTTVTGAATSLARKTALEMIDSDGQARGIAIAKRAVQDKILRAVSDRLYINPRAG